MLLYLVQGLILITLIALVIDRGMFGSWFWGWHRS